MIGWALVVITRVEQVLVANNTAAVVPTVGFDVVAMVDGSWFASARAVDREYPRNNIAPIIRVEKIALDI